jgi:hypothetical protein
MWAKWGSPSIPLGRGDLHITQHELCEQDSISVSCAVFLMFITVDWSDSKVDSACVSFSELFRTEFLDTTTPWELISTGISGSDR